MNLCEQPIRIETFIEALFDAFGDCDIGIPHIIREYYMYVKEHNIPDEEQKYFHTDMRVYWNIKLDESSEHIDAIIYTREYTRYDDERDICIPITAFYACYNEDVKDIILDTILTQLKEYDVHAFYNPG